MMEHVSLEQLTELIHDNLEAGLGPCAVLATRPGLGFSLLSPDGVGIEQGMYLGGFVSDLLSGSVSLDVGLNLEVEGDDDLKIHKAITPVHLLLVNARFLIIIIVCRAVCQMI
jgi:hypothetical protein